MPEHLPRQFAESLAQDVGVLAPAVVAQRVSEVRRMMRGQRWRWAGRCVVTHNGPLTNEQLAWAAVLSPGDRAALARETALLASGVTAIAPTKALTVVTDWGRTPAPIVGVRYVRSRQLSPADLLPAAYPMSCTVERALVDAASRASRDRARTLVAMVVQQRSASSRQVRAVLDRLGPVRQDVLLRVTLDDVEGGCLSSGSTGSCGKPGCRNRAAKWCAVVAAAATTSMPTGTTTTSWRRSTAPTTAARSSGKPTCCARTS
jgi:hypothetical protein